MRLAVLLLSAVVLVSTGLAQEQQPCPSPLVTW